MKSKDSPNLYEILKQSTSGGEAPPETQPRAVATAVEPPPSAAAEKSAPPSAPRIVVPPRPVPPPAPVSATPASPGDRSITVTMNTAIFAGIIAIGVVFLAYAIGVRAGKARGIEESATAPATSPDPNAAANDPGAPPPSNRKLAIKLMEWSGRTAQERVSAEKNADSIRKSLAQASLRDAYYELVTRGDDRFVVLYYGKYDSRTADAREKLSALRKFKYQNRAIFASSDFEEVDP